MNSFRKLLPLLLLLAAAGFLWKQTSERRDIAGEVQRLRSLLVAADSKALPTNSDRPQRKTSLDKDPRDWAAIADELKSGVGVGGLLQTNARLRAAIEGMSVEELLAAMEELKDAGLKKTDRELLEEELAKAILLQSPELGFTRFADRGKGDWSFFLGDEFSQWIERDQAAAVGWLQRHTASGGFVSEQMIQQPFFDLLRSEPGTSAAILASQPPEARLKSLGSLAIHELKNSGQEEWAQIVRSQLPAKDVPEAVAWPVMRWSDGDGSPMLLDEVDAYMKRVGVTDEERKACVLAVAQDSAGWGLSTEEDAENFRSLARMRDWVARQDPELLEPATLVALGEIARGEGFDQAGGLALQFHKDTGNDAYLTAVLATADDNSKTELLSELIGRLSDPALQEKYREEQQHRLK